MGGENKQSDSEQVFLDLVAAWGGLPEDEEAVKEIIRQQLAARERNVAETCITIVHTKKLPVPNPYGTMVRVPKYNQVMEDIKGSIRTRYLTPQGEGRAE